MILKKNNIGQLVASSLAVALVSVISLPAVAQSASAMQSHSATTMSEKMTMNGHAGMQMSQSMNDMCKSMSQMKMSGDVDRDFVVMMKSHHQGAIEMAQMQVDSGKDATVIKAAKKIIVAQKKEIAEFDAWLKKHPVK